MAKSTGSENEGTVQKKVRRGKAPKAIKYTFQAIGFAIDSAHFTVSTVLKAILSLLLVFALTGMLFALIFAYYVKSCLTPTLNISLENYKLSESSTIFYRSSDGTWQELVTLAGAENRIWVDYDQIPEDMINALVAIEDKRFYDHKGVDWYRTSGAFIKMFATMQTNFGGSTITQQLIKNLTGQDEITVQRKLGEIFSALELEKVYNKTEILEWYLNVVYFGEGAYGVQTAAQTYFGKDVQDLTLAQCACIVGITNKPTGYDPFFDEAANKQRQETILREMYEQGFINHDEYIEAVNEDLSAEFVRSANTQYSQSIYTYYEELVIEDVIEDLMRTNGIGYTAAAHLLYNGGFKIYCCLDPDIQAVVDGVYSNVRNIPRTARSNQQLQSSIVVMEPYTGKILAIYGGVGEKTINFGLNRATDTKRSPGSTIKPIASYGPALDLGLITPNTWIMDAQYIHLNGTDWYPSNDGGASYGMVTMYKALSYSINTAAAQIIDILPDGPKTAYDWLTQSLGFTSLVEDDADYAPMALGQFTYGATVREMTAAYCAIVNDGIYTKPRSYTVVTDNLGNKILDNTPQSNMAFKSNTAYCLSYMLQSAVETGTGTEAYLRVMPVAGKTGTSTDYKDRWFIGCTPYYVAAVWTGYDTPERIYADGNPAAQLWRKVMYPIHEGLEYKSFSYPFLGEDTGVFLGRRNQYGELIYDDNNNGGNNGTVSENGTIILG